MAVTRKQDSSNKKEQSKKDTSKRDGLIKKDIVLSKDKKEAPVKKDLPVKKDRVNHLEQVQKFLRGALNELKKVHWPNRREIIIYTTVVIVAVVAVGVLIWLFDTLLSFILNLIL